MSDKIENCKFEEKTEGESIWTTNEFGCSWCDGVGVAPNCRFCSKCTNITKPQCPVREDK